MNKRIRNCILVVVAVIMAILAVPTLSGAIPTWLGMGILMLLAVLVNIVYAYDSFLEGRKKDVIGRIILIIMLVLVGMRYLMKR